MGFKGNIWGVDLADLQLSKQFNQGFKVLLCIIDIFSKYTSVVPLKDKKRVSIVDAFQKILEDSNRSDAKSKRVKPNKIWVDKGSEFYNNSLNKWSKDNDIEIYSIHNERNIIRTLKSKIYQYMTSLSKYVYIDKLDDIVSEYNDTYHRTIKMKPIDVKDNTYIDFKKESNDKDPKFKVGDHAKISKYKNIFTEGYMPNWSEEVFVVSKIKSTVPWIYVIIELNGEEMIGTFYEKELQKTNQ